MSLKQLPKVNNVIPDLVYAGANPIYQDQKATKKQLVALEKLGIEYIVNLQEQHELHESYEDLTDNFRILYLPIVDRKTTDDEAVKKLVNGIYRKIEHKHKIFIHCQGGKGRTGVIVALLLAKYYGYGATKALKETQRLFDTRVDKGVKCLKSPQTREQVSQVKRLLSLPERVHVRETPHAYLFMGYGTDIDEYPMLSNFYPSEFVDEYGDVWYNNEQFYQAMKAFQFDDTEIYEKIRNTKNPKTAKNLGRKVQNFDPKRWNKVSKKYMLEGLRYKFKLPEFQQILLDTGDKLIVESSPWDTVWGSGLDIKHYDAVDPEMFKGTNWLGELLMKVRNEMKES